MAAEAVIAFLAKVGKGASYLGAADAVLTVAEAGLQRAGVIEKDTKILPATVSFLMDVAGVPQPAPRAPSSAPQLPPSSAASSPASTTATSSTSLGEAPAAASTRRHVCPDCLSGRFFLAGAGEEIALVRCEGHEQDAMTTIGQIDAMYLGWAEHEQIDLEGCGKKPNPEKFKNFWGNVEQDKYYKALSQWQQCTQNEKAQKQKQKDAQKKKEEQWKAKDAKEDAAAKAKAKADQASAVAKAKKQAKKLADFALAATKKKYEQMIEELKTKQAEEKRLEEKAAIDKQIAELAQSKADAERLAAEVSAKARDAEHQAQIERLQAEIAANAQKPGGMDEMFKMALMARMIAPPPAAVAPAAAIVDPMAAMMAMDPSAMYPAPPGAAAALANQAMMMDPSFGMPMDPGFGYFAGADDDEPLDPDLAGALGIAGAETLGDARLAFNLRNAWPDEDTSALLADLAGDTTTSSGAGCSLGSCGLAGA